VSIIKVDVAKNKEMKNNYADVKRREAYMVEADPLFFKMQRGEITEAEWAAKIQEIKQRYPKM
jgi:hypothetical protein